MSRLYITKIVYPADKANGFSLLFNRETEVKGAIQAIDPSNIPKRLQNEYYFPLAQKLSQIPGIKKLVIGPKFVDIYLNSQYQLPNALKSAKEEVRFFFS